MYSHDPPGPRLLMWPCRALPPPLSVASQHVRFGCGGRQGGEERPKHGRWESGKPLWCARSHPSRCPRDDGGGRAPCRLLARETCKTSNDDGRTASPEMSGETNRCGELVGTWSAKPPFCSGFGPVTGFALMCGRRHRGRASAKYDVHFSRITLAKALPATAKPRGGRPSGDLSEASGLLTARGRDGAAVVARVP
jgi:hypothetical protein